MSGVGYLVFPGVSAPDPMGATLMVFVGLTAALEAIGATLLDRPRASEADVERCKRAMLRIVYRTLAGPAELGRLLKAEG